MSLNMVTGPTALPLSTAEAKSHLKVDIADDDAGIDDAISTAVDIAEPILNRALVAQQWDLQLDAFPGNGKALRLPSPPVLAVDSITYVDTAGVTQTWATTDYDVDTPSGPRALDARITPAHGKTYPSTRAQMNAVTVRFTAGYAIPFTAANAANLFSPSGYIPAAGKSFMLTNTGGALPSGLLERTRYYVINPTATTIQLSLTSGGAAVDITDGGSGTHFLGAVPRGILNGMLLLIGSLYRTREAENIGNIVNEMPWGVKALWAPYRIMRF